MRPGWWRLCCRFSCPLFLVGGGWLRWDVVRLRFPSIAAALSLARLGFLSVIWSCCFLRGRARLCWGSGIVCWRVGFFVRGAFCRPCAGLLCGRVGMGVGWGCWGWCGWRGSFAFRWCWRLVWRGGCGVGCLWWRCGFAGRLKGALSFWWFSGWWGLAWCFFVVWCFFLLPAGSAFCFLAAPPLLCVVVLAPEGYSGARWLGPGLLWFDGWSVAGGVRCSAGRARGRLPAGSDGLPLFPCRGWGAIWAAGCGIWGWRVAVFSCGGFPAAWPALGCWGGPLASPSRGGCRAGRPFGVRWGLALAAFLNISVSGRWFSGRSWCVVGPGVSWAGVACVGAFCAVTSALGAGR
ncbi:hypothetical protein AZ023_003542 [Klebsiella pneumoniae]|nr:hypothetical protein AZ023_003542 [Klebsiella pneumoniae]